MSKLAVSSERLLRVSCQSCHCASRLPRQAWLNFLLGKFPVMFLCRICGYSLSFKTFTYTQRTPGNLEDRIKVVLQSRCSGSLQHRCRGWHIRKLKSYAHQNHKWYWICRLKSCPNPLFGESILVQSVWGTMWRFLRDMTTDLPSDPTIPLLGIYPN